MMLIRQPPERFSDRVENYAKYRPSYPKSLIDFLFQKWEPLETGGSRVIADLGSGSGIFSELLLKRKCNVYGIEPNQEMRKKSQDRLKQFGSFIAIDGKADHTSLPDSSCDLVCAAQSFHWFATSATVAEISRILKPSGKVALIWNLRMKCPGIMADYETLLREYGTDYALVSANVCRAIAEIPMFFPDCEIISRCFSSDVPLSWEAFLGRHLSLSYVPLESDPIYKKMIASLQKLFDLYQENNQLLFKQSSIIYLLAP